MSPLKCGSYSGQLTQKQFFRPEFFFFSFSFTPFSFFFSPFPFSFPFSFPPFLLLFLLFLLLLFLLLFLFLPLCLPLPFFLPLPLPLSFSFFLLLLLLHFLFLFFLFIFFSLMTSQNLVTTLETQCEKELAEKSKPSWAKFSLPPDILLDSWQLLLGCLQLVDCLRMVLVAWLYRRVTVPGHKTGSHKPTSVLGCETQHTL